MCTTFGNTMMIMLADLCAGFGETTELKRQHFHECHLAALKPPRLSCKACTFQLTMGFSNNYILSMIMKSLEAPSLTLVSTSNLDQSSPASDLKPEHEGEGLSTEQKERTTDLVGMR